MDKTNIVNTFTEAVDQLRNTECSEKEKIACFQKISECITSPLMHGHLNYATFCSKATNILLLFCEDLDPTCRVHAEENLNKIFRVLEKTRAHRILMDLYGEIKRNGNHRSLRICLRIFGYYAPRIREHSVRWYAQNLWPCLKVISRRKETLLQETLSEFVVKFGKNIQHGLTDSETCKLFEAFIENIGSDCAVKRRCTAQNCISLIEYASNKPLMAKYALNKVLEILLTDQQPNTVIGVLGFLRQLVVIVIKGLTLDNNDNDDTFATMTSSKTNNSEESRQLLEIYDYCLYVVSSTPSSQHSHINAALEVINTILQSLDGISAKDSKNTLHIGPQLLQWINDKNLKHAVLLRNKNTLKHQIFSAELFDEVDRSVNRICLTEDITASQTSSDIILLQPQHQRQQHSNTGAKTSGIGVEHRSKRHTARSISECVDIDYVDEDGAPPPTASSMMAMTAIANRSNKNANDDVDDDGDEDDDDGDFTTLSEMNDDSQHTQPSLLGNIDFTTKTSSSVINETISGLVDGSAASKIQRQDDIGSGGGTGDIQKFLVNFSSDDEKSTQLCSTDNESLNSIEFKADISRGLVVQGVHSNSDYNDDQQGSTKVMEEDEAVTTKSSNSSSDAFTTFFNNFNAASESVTKLFRPSGSSSSASKNVISPSTTADSLSLASNVSSLKRTGTEVDVIEDSSPESSKTFPTPSTAIMGEIRSLDSVDIQSTTDVRPNENDTPNVTPLKKNRNPFLNSPSSTRDNSEMPLIPVDIGTAHEQPLVTYTARLIAARFLLAGNPKGLYDDSTVRVSIKNICLNVISQCVRLRPEILEISLKFMQSEKLIEKVMIESTIDPSIDRQSPLQIPSDSSSNIGQDYEHLEVITTVESSLASDVPRKSSFTHLDVFRVDDNNEGPLLEIIDDHFGKSSNDFNFTATTTSTTMTRSADPVLFSKTEETSNSSPIMRTKKDKLSTSEIIGVDTKVKGFVEITKADEDTPPEMTPPRPPKRTKTFRKSNRYNNLKKNDVVDGASTTNGGIQYMQDILYLYNHEDPILRAGVQNIIGHYCRSNQAGLVGKSNINLQYLLAILCMGLQDDIHTVVIQALNTFDKIFPYVLFKYMTTTTAMGVGVDVQGHKQVACHHHRHQHGRQHKEPTTMHNKEQQHCPKPENCTAAASAEAAIHASSTKLKCISGHFNDNDGIIAALLNDFQLQAYINKNNNNDSQATQGNDGVTPNNHIMSNDGGVAAAASVSYDCCSAASLLATCCCCSTSPSASHCCGSNLLFISPKLLLNKLRLCYYNKYWLVQNKYAEVISNLNYASLHSYYGNNYTKNYNHNSRCCFIKGNGCCSTSSDGCQLGCGCCCCSIGLTNMMVVEDDDVDGTDFVCSLENSFIEELLQLIAEDDVRVRECASKCLCRFIIQNAKHSNSHGQDQQQQRFPFVSQDDENILHRTFCDNLRMLQSFFEYSIFKDMSPAVRYLFNPEYQQRNHDDVSTPLDSNVGGTIATNKDAIQTVLSKVLYRLSNKLMSLKDKNVQFGIIYAIKQLLRQFPFADYADAWSEFSFMEIFVKLSQYNYNTAVDLTCQSDLIDVSCKLIVGSSIYYANVFEQPIPRDHIISLLKHTMKIINIYYHIFTNQKPLIMAKSQKVEIFGNAKELTIAQSLGYFGNESIYLKLYQTLKSAYDNYKITINEEAGSKLISLLKTSLNSLSSCIEMLPHEATLSAASSTTTINSAGGGGAGLGIAKNAMDATTTTSTTSFTSPLLSSSTTVLGQTGSTQSLDSVPVLKLIEETLQYLTKVINYAPEESIGCLRQLLKYLFARNYGNRQYQQQQPYKHQMKQGHYPAFIKSYFKAKCKEQHCCLGSNNTTNVTQKPSTTIQLQSIKGLSGNVNVFGNSSTAGSGYSSTVSPQDDYLLLSELFASGLKYHAWKSPHETELARHIKLFEPLVIYCLTLFLKCNGRVQASILDMLILLLDFNVTYSSLDSKNVIFEQILKSLDIIEGGIARNGLFIITPMIRFLIKLSAKNERNLITIPKIISITNNLLANYSIRDVAVRALKTLSYEIFLMTLPEHVLAGRSDSDGGLLRQGTVVDGPNSLATITENLLTLNDELDTQKEVILGMLEKFIESSDCQQLFCLLLLIEQLQQLTMSNEDANIMTTKEQKQSSYDNIEVDGGGGGNARQQHHEQKTTKCLPNLDTVCNMICQSIYTNRLCIQDWHTYRLLDTFFKNNSKYLLGNSREFMALLKYIIEADVTNFSDLSYATIILSNVILKTEEIYLVNHIKLYLKNHPTAVEKLKRKQQQRQQTANTASVGSQQQWLPDGGHDKPSTSSAARAAAAAFSASNSPSSSAGSSSAYNSSGLNEYNYLPTVLCDVLFECLQTLAEQRRNSNSYSHQFSSQYCRLVGNFVKVLNKLCSNTRSDDFLLVSMRSILNGCESRLLNEYHNLLMMYSTQGCPPNATCCAQLSGSSLSTATMGSSTGISASGGGVGGGGVASSLSLASYDATANIDNVMLQLQLELFELLKSVGVLDTLALLQRLQSNDISHHIRRALLNKICQQSVPHAMMEWNLQQVQQLFNGNFLNILIVEQFAFVCNLCEVDEEFCSLFQSTILTNIGVLNKHSIISLLRVVENLCKKPEECSILRFAKCLQILNELHSFVTTITTSSSSSASSLSATLPSSTLFDKRPLQLQIERLARHLIVNSSDTYDKNAIYDTFVHLIEEDEEQQQLLTTSKEGIAASSSGATTRAAVDETASLSSYHFNSSEHLQFMILNDLENSCELNDDDGTPPLGSASNIVDEKWIFNQLIKFSTQNNYDPGQIVKILLEIQSENKLQKIFNTANFDAERILKHTISHALQAMLQTFRNNCIQYNPHIHYMRPNPLARVSLAQLMTRIVEATIGGENGRTDNKATVTNTSTATGSTTNVDGRSYCRKASLSLSLPIHLCEAVIALMENIKQIEVTALIYIESKFIDKFLSEHLLRPEHVNVLVRFIGYCCQRVVALCNNRPLLLNNQEQRNSLTIGLRCIDTLLHQKFIWSALNQQAATTLAKAPSSVAAGSAMDTDEVASTPLTKCELNTIICSLLDVVSSAGVLLLENTPFYKKYKNVLRSSTATTTTHSLASEPQKHQQQYYNVQTTPPHQPQRETKATMATTEEGEENFENIAWLTAKYNSKAIFLGKLIETKIGNYDKGISFGEYNYNYSSTFCPTSSNRTGDAEAQDLKGINNQFDFISLDVLLSIGISTLRMNLFYATAVTPLEIMQQQQRLLSCPPSAAASPSTSPSHHRNQSVTGGTAMVTSNSMLPIIPIESLSDVDILKSFVRRLSIFGFTTRQQFEEYFMTFLLLINKVYDENMVDQQEQFQIRSICLEAIMELLITYKSFPIVGNKLSLYHHTTRWNRINCDSISLKKLHEIQLIISPLNVFYHGNLERNLKTDTVIGTHYFGANQFDLNFIWQQMEMVSTSRQSSFDDSDSGMTEEVIGSKTSTTPSPDVVSKHLSGVAANTAYRNYQYFTRQSGVDYKSSSQLIFDVLMQMIEQNHILILPNLVKFTEICENREQIKQIWEKAGYLKSHIPMDDTISHQYLIYLLCKTKGMLIPSHLEMLSLESLIKNYLKSSHLFVRCAALNGLLSLLESYSKTNTTIGRLSDELVRLKDIILSYIDKHGLIEESPLQCSDLHTKLIWTLNFCLMEWTSKLDPHCNVAYHTKITVGKLLKKTSNEQIYLCVLHGLERMIVQDNKVSNVTSGSSNSSNSSSGVDNQNQMLRPAIEKLALELAKLENEKFSIPALKLLLSCIYVGSSKQLENTELSNGIVQDDPEIIAQQTDKVDILLQCIKTANEEAAWIYGQVLCQMIRDLVPPKEILTKVIKEFLAINQPHSDVIAMIVFQVFRSAIDSSFLQQLQDWLTCSLPTFLSLPEQKAVWSLSVVFLSASINLHLMKLFPLLLNGVKAATATTTTTQTTPLTPTTPTKRMSSTKLGHHEIALFVTSAQDFYAKLGTEQKLRFRDAFKEFHHIKVYNKMLQSL
ncbi:uncharacterized protein LOC133333280 [Musca vetustissima]|uniref:uncharacterized protein LOC133333280 n=1 Tax=Musca vetustissima TaxID=27455 RepID=UPI002AB5EC41|nr:uncharacterized protein LOC133333280 [Musca vetustissima]